MAGTLTKTSELKLYKRGKTTYLHFRMMVQDSEHPTTFLPVIAVGKQAERMAQSATPDQEVFVEAHLDDAAFERFDDISIVADRIVLGSPVEGSPEHYPLKR